MEQILLTKDQLLVLITSNFPMDKANAIFEAIAHKVIINNDNLYVMQPNKTYKVEENSESDMVSLVEGIVSTSYKQLCDDDKQVISSMNKFTKIFSNSAVKSFLPQIRTKLKKDVAFDCYFNEIHFTNGYFDLFTKQLCEREQGKHYITKFIDSISAISR